MYSGGKPDTKVQQHVTLLFDPRLVKGEFGLGDRFEPRQFFEMSEMEGKDEQDISLVNT